VEYPEIQFFSLSVQNTSLHAVLAFKISLKKSAVILLGLPFNVVLLFALTAFNILS
jgi:hypothetical protein